MENHGLEKQIRELDEWIKSNPDSRELKRTLAVKFALQGWRYPAIASALNISKSFISKWKDRFNDRGIEGLKLSYQGSKGYLSQNEKQEVLAWLQEQNYWDIPFSTWQTMMLFPVSFRNAIGENQIDTPHKKTKLQKLSSEQKQQNQEISTQRIIVEYVIRLLKIFRIAQERFRLRSKYYDQVIQVVCGLVRLRIGALILQM
jgi:putative transposase